MSILTKKLHILKTDGDEETANIYTTTTECPEPNLKVNVDGDNGYIKLGDIHHQQATSGRVMTDDENVFAILKTAHQSDFPSAWGEFKSMSFSRFVYRPSTSSYDNAVGKYAWSLHFENGTLPVMLDYADVSANLDPRWFTSDTKAEFNSAFWTKKAGETTFKLYNAQCAFTSSNNFEWAVWYNGQWYSLEMLPPSSSSVWAADDFGITTANYLAPEFTYSVTDKVVSVYKNGTLFQKFNV